MPINKNTMIRISTIDRCLCNRHRLWTLDDLVAHCSEALNEYQGIAGVSRRTVQADIQLMRSEKLGYNAPIAIRDRKYYTYENPDFSIHKVPLSESDMESLTEASELLRHFTILPQMSPVADIVDRLQDFIRATRTRTMPVIHLEKNERLKGSELASDLYSRTRRKETTSLEYKSFGSSCSRTVTLSPYLLKEYRNRWFVTGYVHEAKTVQTLALDRIESLATGHSETAYRENDFFDPKTYFDPVVGVTRTLKSTAMKVILRVSARQAPYVLTKPIHASQHLIRTDDAGIVIALRVCLNAELEREILGFGPEMEVVRPKMLRRRIAQNLQKAAGRYRIDKSRRSTPEPDSAGSGQTRKNFYFCKTNR